MQTPFYNTQHSPVGAFSSFTLGFQGASGGLGLETAGPAKESFWIGCEDREGKGLKALPFFDAESNHPEQTFGIDAKEFKTPSITALTTDEFVRELTPGRDSWVAGDLRFTIFSQIPRIPDPELEDSIEVRVALVPAVLCELVIDNRRGIENRKVFFGWQGAHPQGAMRCVDANRVVGIAQGDSRGFFGASGGWVAGQGFCMEDILEAVRNRDIGSLRHGVGPVGALVAEVPAGGVSVLHLAASFWHGGQVTTGKHCRYWYNRWLQSLEEVADFALTHSDALARASKEADGWLTASGLSRERRWMLAQAVRSYYGSSQLLEDQSRPGEALWVVNEGEYRMMNTLDLTIDQFFFEIKRHPWAVRSVLDLYLRDYSSQDSLGLAFRHDMGVANSFTPAGTSAYEQPHRKGCFSFMCQEELVNWILCAVGYGKIANDIDWLQSHRHDLAACRASLSARDHVNPEHSIGLMQFDSDRCDGGYEITTYDSLDQSLGPARGNLYLAVKTWAAWLALEWQYKLWDLEPDAQEMHRMALKASQTICRSYNAKTGMFPALLDGSCDSAIIPAIEGLIFPWLLWGDAMVGPKSPFGEMIGMLRKHLKTAMLARCRFPDGGWKLSESSDNSWLSKIYLCQAVAEKILGWKDSEGEQADRVHQSWLLDPENAFYAWSDQMLAGKVCGSRYYPRGVTAVLWLKMYANK